MIPNFQGLWAIQTLFLICFILISIGWFLFGYGVYKAATAFAKWVDFRAFRTPNRSQELQKKAGEL
jgi:hypothetical protein